MVALNNSLEPEQPKGSQQHSVRVNADRPLTNADFVRNIIAGGGSMADAIPLRCGGCNATVLKLVWRNGVIHTFCCNCESPSFAMALAKDMDLT